MRYRIFLAAHTTSVAGDGEQFKAFCPVCMKETWIVELACTKCGTYYGN